MKLIIKFSLIIIIATSGLIFFAQKLFIYPGAYLDKSGISSVPSQNITMIPITTEDDIKIQLFELKSNNHNSQKALLMFHGNADAASNIILSAIDKGLIEKGIDVFALEYRGYNYNKGTPSEEGFHKDAKAALKYLKDNGYKKIMYYGHSLGTGVAVGLTKEHTPLVLILEAPFTSLADLAHNLYPFVPTFAFKLLLKDKYDSIGTLQETELPYLLILHGELDNIISVEQGKRLFNSANAEHKQIRIFEQGSHNNLADLSTQDFKVFMNNVRALEDKKFRN